MQTQYSCKHISTPSPEIVSNTSDHVIANGFIFSELIQTLGKLIAIVFITDNIIPYYMFFETFIPYLLI